MSDPGHTDLEVVQSIYAAFERRDVEAALAFCSPEIELHLPATADLAGREATYRGHNGVRRYFLDAQVIWDEITLHAEDFQVRPGRLVVRGYVALRRGEETSRRAVVWTWKVRDGLAVSVRVSDVGEFTAR